MESKVQLQRNAHLATLTLNRPEVSNAFDQDVILELTQHLKELATDPEVRVLLLRGEGKHFSAGADLNWMRRMANFGFDENLKDAQVLAQMMRLLNEFPTPTIACVQGAAFGGAVGLAACCDIVLGTPKTKFCLSEVKLGLVPAVISPYVIAAIGQRQARRYMQTAEVITAEKALSLNLLHEIFAEERLLDEAKKIATGILQNGPEAVTTCKILIREIMQCKTPDAQDNYSTQLISASRASSEGQEGLSAFLEKRHPSWQNNSS